MFSENSNLTVLLCFYLFPAIISVSTLYDLAFQFTFKAIVAPS